MSQDDITTLVEKAKCIEQCIPPGMQLPVLIALVAEASGISLDPKSLMERAKCIVCEVPEGMQLPVLIDLTNQSLS